MQILDLRKPTGNADIWIPLVVTVILHWNDRL